MVFFKRIERKEIEKEKKGGKNIRNSKIYFTLYLRIWYYKVPEFSKQFSFVDQNKKLFYFLRQYNLKTVKVSAPLELYLRRYDHLKYLEQVLPQYFRSAWFLRRVPGISTRMNGISLCSQVPALYRASTWGDWVK